MRPLVVIFRDIREGNLGAVFDGAATGKLGREGADVLTGLAFEGESVVFAIYDDADLVPVLPGEGGGPGTGIVDDGFRCGFCESDPDGYFFRCRACRVMLGNALGGAGAKHDGEKGIDCFFHNSMDLEVPIAPGGGIPFDGIRNRGFAEDRTNQEGPVCMDLNRYRFWTEIRRFHVAYIYLSVQKYRERMDGDLPFSRFFNIICKNGR